MTPREVLALVRSSEAKTVDLRFMDFPGVWQHFAIPAKTLTEHTFEEGVGFDGSSVAGWRKINEADLLVVPQAETALIDPFSDPPSVMMICNIQDPITKQDYTRDPRNIARKAMAHMRATGLADEALFGPELEFFVFDDVRFDSSNNHAFHYVDSVEGHWNRGKSENPNLGYKPRSALGYFPCPPADTLVSLRAEIAQILEDRDIPYLAHFHEAASAGQCEIDLARQDLVRAADHVTLVRYIARNVARRRGKTATFMPKPLHGDNGSGMHTHFSLRKEGRSVLAGHMYAGLGETGMHAVGGILKHARALCAFANPTTNSYKRLVPGFEAPTRLTYSRRNREAVIRIPVHGDDPDDRRIEYRGPDSAANPYLLFSAMLMAALDGIQTKADPGEPYDRDVYDLNPALDHEAPAAPRSLEASLEALQADQEFLLRGDVFTPDVIDTWIWYKRTQEADAIRERPHPHEFSLYFDI